MGTSGDITSLNINPVVSYRLNDKLSIAGGFSFLYLDSTLKKNINQTAVYKMVSGQDKQFKDIHQKFEGEGWGYGYNLGLLYKATDYISFGATYRSQIDVDVEGRATFDNVDPNLGLVAFAFRDTDGTADVKLPAQATVGIAVTPWQNLVVEVGGRWEDWASTDELKIKLASPVMGQTSDTIPRDWKATWSYNIGGQYQINESFNLTAGYLFGKDAVPGSTFDPLVPDTNAHLFTLGGGWTTGAWTITTAFGYEHHERGKKDNSLGDPLGSMLTGTPTDTANGTYESDIYLSSLSVSYRF